VAHNPGRVSANEKEPRAVHATQRVDLGRVLEGMKDEGESVERLRQAVLAE
jgi:hypothetical protein